MTTISTPNAMNSPVVQGGDPAPTVTSPIVDPSAPAPTSTPDPIVVQHDTPPAAAAPDPAAPDPKAATPNSTPEWLQKRFDEITYKRYEAERLAKDESAARVAAEARVAELLAQLGSNKPPANQNQPVTKAGPTPEEIDRMVSEQAARLAATQRFNETCNSVAAQGAAEFSDWRDTLSNLQLVGALGQGASPDFLETAIELSTPHKVLHYLGKNMEEAEKITKLPPKRMAVEMARIEAKINAPAPAPAPTPVSSAPAPIIPVAGAAKTGGTAIDDPHMSTADFMALRNKQVREKRGY